MNTDQILKVLKNERECILSNHDYCYENCNEFCPYYVSGVEKMEVLDFLIKGYELLQNEGAESYTIKCTEKNVSLTSLKSTAGRLDVIRPHGEWNYIQAGMCVCPFCGAIPHKLYKDFCAKCGADMRPKKKLQTPSCLTNPERQAELLERYKEE